jgi:hypothetical protein
MQDFSNCSDEIRDEVFDRRGDEDLRWTGQRGDAPMCTAMPRTSGPSSSTVSRRPSVPATPTGTDAATASDAGRPKLRAFRPPVIPPQPQAQIPPQPPMR